MNVIPGGVVDRNERGGTNYILHGFVTQVAPKGIAFVERCFEEAKGFLEGGLHKGGVGNTYVWAYILYEFSFMVGTEQHTF